MFPLERPKTIPNINVEGLALYIDVDLWNSYKSMMTTVENGRPINLDNNSQQGSSIILATHCES